MSRPLTVEGSIVGTFSTWRRKHARGQGGRRARRPVWAFGATLCGYRRPGEKAFQGKSHGVAGRPRSSSAERRLRCSAWHRCSRPELSDRLVRACLCQGSGSAAPDCARRQAPAPVDRRGRLAGRRVPMPVAQRRQSRAGAGVGTRRRGDHARGGARGRRPRLRGSRSRRPSSLQHAAAAADSQAEPGAAARPRPTAAGSRSSPTIPVGRRHICAVRSTRSPLSRSRAPTRRGSRSGSPDSRCLAYFSEGRLRRIAVGGGPVVMVGDAARPDAGGSWGRGFILFGGLALTDSIRMLPIGGGAARPASHHRSRGGRDETPGPISCRTASTSSTRRSSAPAALHRAHQARHDRLARGRALGECDGRVEYAVPGYLVFTRDGTLMAQRFRSRLAVGARVTRSRSASG